MYMKQALLSQEHEIQELKRGSKLVNIGQAKNEKAFKLWLYEIIRCACAINSLNNGKKTCRNSSFLSLIEKHLNPLIFSTSFFFIDTQFDKNGQKIEWNKDKYECVEIFSYPVLHRGFKRTLQNGRFIPRPLTNCVGLNSTIYMHYSLMFALV